MVMCDFSSEKKYSRLKNENKKDNYTSFKCCSIAVSSVIYVKLKRNISLHVFTRTPTSLNVVTLCNSGCTRSKHFGSKSFRLGDRLLDFSPSTTTSYWTWHLPSLLSGQIILSLVILALFGSSNIFLYDGFYKGGLDTKTYFFIGRWRLMAEDYK